METNQKNNIIVIRVVEIVHLFLRKLWIIVLVGALLGAAGYGYSKMTEEAPMYMTTTKLYVTGVESAVPSAAGINLGQQVLNSYIEILESRPVMEQVIENLNLNMTYRELQGCISEYIPEETCMLEISVAFPEPEWAKKVADELVVVSAARALEIMGCTAPTVYEEAYVPTEPYNIYGSSLKYMVLGAFAGAVLAGFGILVSYFVNTKITNPYKVSDRLHIPAIGVFPDSAAKNKVYEEGAYQSFCSGVRSMIPNGKIIEFLSATEKENKYELMQKVAKVYSEAGKKVMLVDINLSNPKWGAVEQAAPNKKGLEEYLKRNVGLEDIIVKREDADYIYCKEAVIDAADLICNETYVSLMAELKEMYDYILINGAPLEYAADGAFAAKEAEAKILVLSGKISRIGQVKKVLNSLEEAHIKVNGATLIDMDIHKGGKYFLKEFGKYFGVYGK